jgi:hypothetical protein
VIIWGVKQALEGYGCVDEDSGGWGGGRGVRMCLRGGVVWGRWWGWGCGGFQFYPVNAVGYGLGDGVIRTVLQVLWLEEGGKKVCDFYCWDVSLCLDGPPVWEAGVAKVLGKVKVTV